DRLLQERQRAVSYTPARLSIGTAMLDTPTRIEIIGALTPGQEIDETRILQALSGTEQKLSHGGRFTGRPGTKLFSSEDLVVKLREELQFSPRDMRRWIERALEKERRLGVHAPQKTWFLLHDASRVVIANVTPRLQALHDLGN